MVPVYPYHIRRSNAGDGGEMLLSLKDRKSAMVLQLSMDQARMLAVEMRGLATDHCSLHHLVLAVTKSLGAEVSGVLIKGVDYGQVTGAIRMEYEDRILDVNVDVAAALAVALHLGLPIFMDSLYMLREDRLEPIAAPIEVTNSVPIPEAFREIIETLELPASLEGEEREEREM
jgi:bifunctional DNase/RNase